MNVRQVILALTGVLLMTVTPWANQTGRGDEYLVAEWGTDAITRLVDLNGDGDAFDTGEQTLWADAVGGPQSLSLLQSTLYVIDNNADVLRFEDLNLDGDALDVGEWSVFADGFSVPGNIATRADGSAYVSDASNNGLWQLVDLNNDGDALDVAERTLYASGLEGADDVILFGDGLLVSTNVSNQVYRLADLNGDGDALDIGENLPIADLVEGGIGGARGLLEDGDGGFFVTSALGGTVSHAQDMNGDGDMLDVAEVVLYADSFYGTLGAPWSLAASEGALLAVDADLGTIARLFDANGDGDALDIGETVLFADGLATALDIAVVLPPGPPLLPGDGNGDGMVNGLDYLLWAANFGDDPAMDPPGSPENGDYNNDNKVDGLDYLVWASNFGTGTSTAVPEPATGLLLMVGTFTWAVRRRIR